MTTNAAAQKEKEIHAFATALFKESSNSDLLDARAALANDATSFRVAERTRRGSPWALLNRIPPARVQRKILSSLSDTIVPLLQWHVRTFNWTKLSESQSFKGPRREQDQDTDSDDCTKHRMRRSKAFDG